MKQKPTPASTGGAPLDATVEKVNLRPEHGNGTSQIALTLGISEKAVTGTLRRISDRSVEVQHEWV